MTLYAGFRSSAPAYFITRDYILDMGNSVSSKQQPEQQQIRQRTKRPSKETQRSPSLVPASRRDGRGRTSVRRRTNPNDQNSNMARKRRTASGGGGDVSSSAGSMLVEERASASGATIRVELMSDYGHHPVDIRAVKITPGYLVRLHVNVMAVDRLAGSRVSVHRLSRSVREALKTQLRSPQFSRDILFGVLQPPFLPEEKQDRIRRTMSRRDPEDAHDAAKYSIYLEPVYDLAHLRGLRQNTAQSSTTNIVNDASNSSEDITRILQDSRDGMGYNVALPPLRIHYKQVSLPMHPEKAAADPKRDGDMPDLASAQNVASLIADSLVASFPHGTLPLNDASESNKYDIDVSSFEVTVHDATHHYSS